MENKEFDELGQKIQDIIDRAVSSKNYQELNRNINKTVNKAIDSGSETLRKALDEAFRTGSDYTKKYENRTREFEERRRRERLEQEQREQNEKRERELLALYNKPVGLQVRGVLFTVFGGIFVGGFGITGLVLMAVSTLMDMSFLGGSAFFAGGALLAGGFLAAGCRDLGKISRFKKYCRALGTHTYCNFDTLSRAVGKPLKFVKKDIRNMILKGWFPEGHVDGEETCLITSNETYGQYEETRKQLELRSREEGKLLQEKAAREQETKVSQEVQEILDRGNAYLRKIKASNDAIPGEEISAKISRMELIIAKIFERAESHPEIIPDLKHLMDYYLPMTVKLLDAYEDMDSQPIQGENIRSSKKEIEDTLDTLNQAFEKLLDSIFQDTAWDVSSDISVLHTMLAQEGLTENDFEKMKNA